MKSIISVCGKFNAFMLAEELSKRNILSKLICNHPYKSVKYIPENNYSRILSVYPLVMLELATYFLKLGIFSPYIYWKKHDFYDKQVAKLLPELKKEGADIFHFCTNQGLSSLLEAKRLGMITVADCSSTALEYQHDIVREEYARFDLEPKGFYSIFNDGKYRDKVIERGLLEYREADYILAPSDFVKETFPKELQYKVHVVPYGISTRTFKKVKKKDKKFRVLFCGRMELQKGVQYLLEAFSQLDLPNSELLLMGFVENDFKPILRQHLGCCDNKIKVLGYVSKEELIHNYSQGSVYVHCSIQEGLSLTLLEAMSCGLPAIATENTGAGMVIKDGVEGYVVKMRDIEALKRTIQYMYDFRGETERMGNNAYKKIREEFTIETYGERMEEFYKKIIKKREDDVWQYPQ